MVTHLPTPERQYEDTGVEYGREPGTNLIVMHARHSRATNVLVIDADLGELESTGHLLGAQGFKVTLSSALLDFDSLDSFAADLLVVRPPADRAHDWGRYLTTLRADRRFRELPVVWLASPGQMAAGSVLTTGAHILPCPWRPFDFLTLVDSLVATSSGSESIPPGFSSPGQPLANLLHAGHD